MSMYILIEYSDAYSKTSGSFWQYYSDKQALDNNDNITDFSADNNNNKSFKSKQQMTEQKGNGGANDFKIMFVLKYLSNFWRTRDIPIINCEIN